MQNLWTFPKSTDNSLIFIKDNTIYISIKQGETLANQLKSIKADRLPKDLTEIHFEDIEQVIFHKNKIEIHQKDAKTTLFIDDNDQINEVFYSLKEEIPALKYTVTQSSVISHIKIHLLFAILVFARLMYYLFEIADIGQRAELSSLQEYYGVAYGNFVHGFASFGLTGVVIIGIVYILIALFFLNNSAEKRPYTKTLKRV